VDSFYTGFVLFFYLLKREVVMDYFEEQFEETQDRLIERWLSI
jgi:hypothetical protein